MPDFIPHSESPRDPAPSDQPSARWRGWFKLLGRFLLALLTPMGLGRMPEDDYGAKDLDGGGLQTLFGSDKQRKKSWWKSS
jgi:hypothetical protein